jgi:polyphosphate kinase
MSVRIADLRDAGRPAAERAVLAGAFIRELDAVFAGNVRYSRRRLHQLVAAYDEVLHEELLPELAAEGPSFVSWEELSPIERVQTHRRLHRSAYPLLTPMVVDSTHPVPRLTSLAISLGARVDGRLVHVALPPHLPRMLSLRAGRFVPLESVVTAVLPELLVGVRIADCSPFRITRSAATGQIVRMEVTRTASDSLVELLASRFGVADGEVFRVRSALAMGEALAVAPRTLRAVPQVVGAATDTPTESSA